jgi:hypothetical protein
LSDLLRVMEPINPVLARQSLEARVCRGGSSSLQVAASPLHPYPTLRGHAGHLMEGEVEARHGQWRSSTVGPGAGHPLADLRRLSAALRTLELGVLSQRPSTTGIASCLPLLPINPRGSFFLLIVFGVT